MSNKNDKLSVFISLILRHKPEVINITLDKHGYASVDELIEGVNTSGKKITLEILEDIVKTDEQGRYSFSEDKTKIRANQGHSIDVDLGLKEAIPPKVLYHGTAVRNLDIILNDAIKKMDRLHVHLSDNLEAATRVGKRHGKPIIFKVNTERMIEHGYKFYLSDNGVWLTDVVPNFYVEVLWINMKIIQISKNEIYLA